MLKDAALYYMLLRVLNVQSVPWGDMVCLIHTKFWLC